jgi:hypothetical protein
MNVAQILAQLRANGFGSAIVSIGKNSVLVFPSLSGSSNSSAGIAYKIQTSSDDVLVLGPANSGNTTIVPLVLSPNPLKFPVALRVGGAGTYGVGLTDAIAAGNGIGIITGPAIPSVDSSFLKLATAMNGGIQATGAQPINDGIPQVNSVNVPVPTFIANVEASIGGSIPPGMTVITEAFVDTIISTADIATNGKFDSFLQDITMGLIAKKAAVEAQGVAATNYDERAGTLTLSATLGFGQPANALAAPMVISSSIARNADAASYASVSRTYDTTFSWKNYLTIQYP